jgi:hypothetical protein
MSGPAAPAAPVQKKPEPVQVAKADPVADTPPDTSEAGKRKKKASTLRAGRSSLIVNSGGSAGLGSSGEDERRTLG